MDNVQKTNNGRNILDSNWNSTVKCIFAEVLYKIGSEIILFFLQDC
jgi:hypothetical protein